MRKLLSSSSVQVTMMALRYLRVQLPRLPKVEGPNAEHSAEALIAEANAQLSKLKQAVGQHEEAEIERMAVNAELKRIGKENNKLDVQIGRELRALVRGDTQDPRFLRMFPEAPSVGAGLSKSYLEQKRFTANIKHLIETDEAFSALRSYLPEIDDLMHAFRKTLHQRDLLLNAEKQALVARNVAMDEVKAFYNQAYARLTIAYPGQEALIETCFYAIPKSRKGNADDSASEEDAGEEEEG